MRGRKGGLVVALVALVCLAVAPADAWAAKPDGGGKPGGGSGGGGGKPGYPDRIEFAGRTWQVKSSHAAVGPGPCVYSASNVSVDADGRLHLRVERRADGTWTCGEVVLDQSLGYGTYSWALASDVSGLDPNVVLGLFTWSDKPQYAHRELDVEVARWGDASDPTNAQYVVQPDSPSTLHRFTLPPSPSSTHSFTWTSSSVAFASAWTGGSHAWTYDGTGVPRAGGEAARMNLWLHQGLAPTNGQAVEVVISAFSHTPA